MSISEAFELYNVRVLKARGKSYKTYQNYRSAISSLLRTIGDTPIELLESVHIDRWELEMRAEGNADTTIATNLSKIRKILSYLRSQGMNLYDPENIELPKAKSKPKPFLYPEEISRMISHTSRLRDKALIACLASTGARIAEVLSLTREQISRDEIWVSGKNGKYMRIRIDPRARTHLDVYLETRTDPFKPVFLSDQRKQMTAKRVGQILQEISAMAGIEKHVTAHVFRHSFATDLFINGASAHDVKDMLNHESISTTVNIYRHVPDSHNLDVYQKFHSY